MAQLGCSLSGVVEGLGRLGSGLQDLHGEVLEGVTGVPVPELLADEVGDFVRPVGIEAVTVLELVGVPLVVRLHLLLAAQSGIDLLDAETKHSVVCALDGGESRC